MLLMQGMARHGKVRLIIHCLDLIMIIIIVSANKSGGASLSVHLLFHHILVKLVFIVYSGCYSLVHSVMISLSELLMSLQITLHKCIPRHYGGISFLERYKKNRSCLVFLIPRCKALVLLYTHQSCRKL